MLWEKQGLRVESLMGVARNRFVATLAGPVRGIRAFDTKTGSDESPAGWQNHDDPGLASLGRGLVSDEQILWPTRAGLFVLRSSDGRLARPPILGPHGNLAYAEGVLVVANPTELMGYVIPEATRTPRLPIPELNDALPKRIAIAAPATIAVAHTPPTKPLPPIVVRERTKTVAVPWANGVLPSDERAGTWLVGRDCVARVSQLGDVGEKINTKFTPTRVTAIGSKFAFSNGETIFRPDTEATFDIRDLHAEYETVTALTVGHGLLAIRIGEHHLAALDAVTFQVKWVIDATGRVGYWPYHHSSPNRFGPHLLVTSSGIVCQRLDGQMLMVEPTTGAVRFQSPTTTAPWSRPPLLHGERLLVPGGPGQIVAFEPSDGERLWGSETPNVSGLSGLSPSLHRVEEDLFVGIVRNHGVELQHLALDTGRLKWRRPVFISQQSTVPFGLDGDGGTVFASTNDSVVAVRKIDGRMLWRQPLPHCTAGWNVNTAIGGVILSPRTALEKEPTDDSYLVRSLVRFPEPRRAFGHLSTWLEAAFDRTVSILTLEPTTGRELSRIDLPAVGMGVDCRFHASGGVVATAGSIYLLK